MTLRLTVWLACILFVMGSLAAEEVHLQENADQRESIQKLIVRLDSEDFGERETAQRELLKIGEPTLPFLKKALSKKHSAS